MGCRIKNCLAVSQNPLLLESMPLPSTKNRLSDGLRWFAGFGVSSVLQWNMAQHLTSGRINLEMTQQGTPEIHEWLMHPLSSPLNPGCVSVPPLPFAWSNDMSACTLVFYWGAAPPSRSSHQVPAIKSQAHFPASPTLPTSCFGNS